MIHHRVSKIITIGCMLVILFLIAGCGEQKSAEQVGSFREGITITDESVDSANTIATIPILLKHNDSEKLVPEQQLEPQTDLNEINVKESAIPSPQGSKEVDSTLPTPTVPIAIPTSKPTEQVSTQQQSTSTHAATNKQPSDKVKPEPTKAPTVEPIKPDTEPKKETKKSKYQSISWNGFFDNVEQNTPSNDFWDLSEAKSTVQIKGFMGEILSLDKNWFLLIPEPGAECPFDNGDETYWNKIMIVYVEDGTKLRYTSKPLQITGRLDVGVKVDESGYKTMFRLYDANFEEIKE
ncbi:hypothetical protein [Paenibacillus endoradicis]|uniref:hypothetical protein n=1 Tax=Paenibacillus endoradicis TaxID=2972487 RepID=UPI00215969AB|nr:hypothetical protein [Paenibacillus endoradicis]MCR8659449.1 hypothetical protein [Paenibacillus endoradicis]